MARRIEPRQPGPLARTAEFWRHRHLLPYFGKRYLQKRYARTWLGWLWVPIRPVMDVLPRVLIFGALLEVPSDGTPYLLFFLVGYGAWHLFGMSLYWATRSVELNIRYLKRIYLPRLTLLVSALTPALVEYGIYLVLLALATIGYLVVDGEQWLAFGPELVVAALGLVLAVWLALSIGLFTSVYCAQARDVRFALRYVIGFWFYLTPVIYPLSAVPEGYQTLAQLNPMTAPMEMVKFGLLGAGEVQLVGVLASLCTVAALSTTGLWFFARSEARALDSL